MPSTFQQIKALVKDTPPYARVASTPVAVVPVLAVGVRLNEEQYTDLIIRFSAGESIPSRFWYKMRAYERKLDRDLNGAVDHGV